MALAIAAAMHGGGASGEVRNSMNAREHSSKARARVFVRRKTSRCCAWSMASSRPKASSSPFVMPKSGTCIEANAVSAARTARSTSVRLPERPHVPSAATAPAVGRLTAGGRPPRSRTIV